jgi:hypothetical protein
MCKIKWRKKIRQINFSPRGKKDTLRYTDAAQLQRPSSDAVTELVLHRKKRFTSFPAPAGMSLTKLPLGGNNSVMTSLFPPRDSLVVTSRLGTGNSRSFFTVYVVVFTKPTGWDGFKKPLKTFMLLSWWWSLGQGEWNYFFPIGWRK